MKYVKIYGERNSGTIYLEWLLKKNLKIDIAETYDLGWKHRIAPSNDELNESIKKNVVFLCLVKNPYSWLLSLHMRPYLHECLKKLGFSDFIKYSYGDYRNPVVMWNQKNNSYWEMRNYVEHYEFFRYEDILAEPANVVNLIAERYDYDKPSMFRNINNQLSNSRGMLPGKFHKDYYLKESWKRNLRSDHVKLINEFIDTDLMKKLNYEIL